MHFITTLKEYVVNDGYEWFRQLCNSPWVPFAFSFLLIYFSIYLGLLAFREFDLEFATIWPSIGIALALIYLYGARIIPALILAQLFILLTIGPVDDIPLVALTIIMAGYTVEPIIGASLLKYLQFERGMTRTRDAMIIIGVALLLPVISASFMAFSNVYQFTDGYILSFGRAWAAGVFSILVFTPLVTTWSKSYRRALYISRTEMLTAFAVLLVAIYITFWTENDGLQTFLALYGLFTALMWLGLRANPRMITTAIAFMAVFGSIGILFNSDTSLELNRTLLSTQLFTILITPIFYIISTTVLERRRSERSLSEYAQELESTLIKLAHEDNSKNKFIATLAHELRNPLAPLLNTVELMQLTSGTTTDKELLNQAHRQLNSMRRLLDDLLDVARVTQNRFRLKRERVDARIHLQNCIENVGMHIRERSHVLSTSFPEGRIWMNVDPVRFEQIVNNLLHNAAKYTEPGGNIHLEVTQTSTETYIRVSDDGVGIDPSMQKRIFEPFEQVPTITHFGTGLGIGLSLTKQLVALHGGSLKVESAGLGHGSTFIVCFPKRNQCESSSEQNETNSEKELLQQLQETNEDTNPSSSSPPFTKLA